MPFAIPSIKDLAQKTRTSFKTEMPSTDPWLWPSTLTVVSTVFAGIVWSIFGRLKDIDKQRFASTATGKDLERHGAELGISRKAASYATGNFNVVGTASTTASVVVIASGTTFTRSDGVVYTSSISVDMSLAGTASIPVVANATGPASNTIYGTALTCSDANVTSTVVDNAGIGGGASTELDEELRARILYRKRNPPQGGALADYVQWATSLSGVTRAFVDGGDGSAVGAGNVIVYPMLDVANSSNYGLPQPVDLTHVLAYLNVAKPVTARVFVVAPTPYPIDVVVSGLTPSSASIRQAAADEIYNSVYRNAVVTTSTAVNILHRSWIWQAVASVTGQQYFNIVSPAADQIIPSGSIPVVRSVQFT